MNRHFSKPTVLLLFFMLTAAIFPGAAMTLANLTMESAMDWEKGQLNIRGSYPLTETTDSFPTAKQKTRQFLEKNSIHILQQSLSSLQLDSWYTMKSYLRENSELLKNYQLYLSSQEPVNIQADENLSQLYVDFSLKAFPDLALFILPEGASRKLPTPLKWSPSDDYTGIVIYIDGPLRYSPYKKETVFVPSLFPKVLDEYHNQLSGIEVGDRDYMLKWGSAALSSIDDESLFTNRVGIHPLRLTARALYGRIPTDVIISNDSAVRLLTRKNNRKLLEEGRILIIYSES